MALTTQRLAAGFKRGPNDALASAWLLVVGSLFIAYYWWRHHQGPSTPKPVKEAVEAASKWAPTPYASSRLVEPGAPAGFSGSDLMRWPQAAIRAFQSPTAAAEHAAQLRAFHIQGDPMEGLH